MLRIGDFSKLARVTIKTLHHYADWGLLPPAHIDPQSGYRYYRAAQLETLERILALKDLGFSLGEIRELLGGAARGDELRQKLEERREHIAAEIAADRARLRRLDALRDALEDVATAEPPHVTVRAVPSIVAHSVRARVPRLGTSVEAMFEQAEAVVARASARADASPFLLFHDVDHRDEQIDVEACIPVEPCAGANIETRVVEGCRAMGCATYRGPYERTAEIYATMLRWLERSGADVAGPLREVYHRFGAAEIGYRLPRHRLASTSADFVTELQVPTSPAAGEARP
jgi:DNA-binding transcriptional MerR regulator/effector-binding domain-containing protein